MKKSLLAIFIFAAIFTRNIFSQQNYVPYCEKIGTYACGKWPKAVTFSTDEKYIVMPLLDEDAFDIFDLAQKKVVKKIHIADKNLSAARSKGFVECIFLPQKNTFLVSQMNAGKLYEYSADNFEFQRGIQSYGVFPKIMAWCPQKSMLATSNWVSSNVSLIDYETGNLVQKIVTSKSPRGLAFLKGGTQIITLAFDGGDIQKFDTATGKELAKISIPKSAMRHIVLSADEKKAWISDMYFSKVYEVDIDSFKITNQMKVFNNPNTIDILENRFLFVSSRGPNDPVDYTRRSPKDGKIAVIDTEKWVKLFEIQGGNQPTGLDISPSGKYLCFSNFQDGTIELYEIKWKPGE